MDRLNPEKYKSNLSNQEVTDIVAASLFYLYRPGDTPKYTDFVDGVAEVSRYQTSDCETYIRKMFDKQWSYLMPVVGDEIDSGRTLVRFGVSGLWLLEDAFMHGEETVDSMALAESILKKAKFFD